MQIQKRRNGKFLKLGTGAVALFVMLLGGLSAVTPETAQADPPDSKGGGNETKEIKESLRKSDAPVIYTDENGLPPKARGDQNRTPKLGDFRYWLALDDFSGNYYLKLFQLRGESNSAEAWVAVNLNFPTGDCRNGIRTVITNEQISYVLSEFDNTIRPIDVDWFGEPLKRTGTDAIMQDIVASYPGGSKGDQAYHDSKGRDVILIDNVRDDNYYDFNNSQSLSYIAGFFTTAMPFYHDRNVITIDAFDWLHRTGDNPPHSPSEDPCLNMPARPNLYEGVFAHEYQHLIHADYDADEVNWVNEGMSDLAEILTGYSNPDLHIDEMGADGHILNFLGWANVFHEDWNTIPRLSGPENSLTVWEDQGPLEILGDYGHAYYFMTYLQSQGYDQAFFTEWAHNPLNGIEGLNDSLAAAGSGETFASLFLDMQTAALADAFIDAGAPVTGEVAADISNDATNSTIHFTSNAYATTGAPPWGSDYIPLGPGSALTSVSFNGDDSYVFPSGPQWVVANGYFAVVPTGTYDSNMDASITHEISVGASSTLSFDHYYDMEVGWDFGFVQISTDNGATWASLACTGTTTTYDPGGVLPAIVDNLPGYTGTAGSAAVPISVNCSLSGQPVGPALIAFRFMSDSSVEETGWFVKNVRLDGTPVGSVGSLAGWNNQKFYDPADLGFTLRLVGLTGTVDEFGHVTGPAAVVVVDVPLLDGANTGSLNAAQLAPLASSTQVIAIVSGVPETEDNGIYGSYSLTVNDAPRADGAGVVNPW